MEHIEGTIEVVGIGLELTEIIMSMANELTQLRLANDVAVLLQNDLTWDELYSMKQLSWKHYSEQRGGTE
mgnify:CR=1 FL=1|jgi:hypothetical protein|tara:strand:+ start:2542 stop:2751 length:210 start_codon:yes stop_codon:yes gene_type:complete